MGGGEGNRDADDDKEETPRVPSSPFLREGDEGALASSSPVSLGDDVGPESISVCTNN